MADKARILILEDKPADAELIEHELRGAEFRFISRLVQTEGEYRKTLFEFSPDIILSAYEMLQFTGAEALRISKELRPDIPFILLTGAVGEERAIENLTGGAADYVMKSRLTRLVPAVMRALKEAEEIKKRKAAEAERDFLLSRLEDRVNERTAQLQAEIAQRSRVERGARANEKRIVSILESITDGFTAWDHDWRCTYVNSSAERLFKKRREDLLGKDVREVFPEAGYLFSRYEAAMNENKRVSFEEYYRPMSMWIEVRAYPAADGGFSVFFRDITEHRLAEQKVLLSEEKFSKAFYGNTAAMSITRLHDGLIIEANDRWCELLDLSREDVVGKTTIEINLWKDAGGRVQWANDLERDGVIRNREYTFLKHNNEEWTGVTSSQVGILHGERVAFNSVIDITERKRAEKALKESEQRLRRASCAGQTGLFEWNAGHDITYWSHEAYDLFGLEPDSPVDFARVISCIHPDDRQRVADTAVKVLNQARTGPDAISHKDEFRVLHKDGTVRWIESTSASELENGDMIVRGAVRDITDRKQAEENLRQSEERYRDIFEGAVEGIYQTTKEGLILRANPAFARMFGFSSPREMIDSVMDLGRQIYVDPDDRERMMTLVKHDNVEGFEAEVYRKDKSRFWMSINLHAVRDEAGNILCFEGTIIDITERKKAEAALRESEEMHRQLFDAAPDAMIVYREGRILSANALALKLYGAETIEQLQSKTLLDLIHPEYRDTVSERMRRVEAGQSVKFEEIAVVRFDGRVVPVESVANIINNHTGETVIQVIRDITERRQAEEAVRASTKKTETVLASITDMYVSYDNEWRFVDLNPVAEKLIGRTRRELIGKVLWEVFPRLRESEIHEHYLKAVRDKSTRSFEAYSPVTGRWQEFYLYPADDGLSVYLRDISDRKQMEEALRKSKDELEIKVQGRTHQLSKANKALLAEIDTRRRIAEELQKSEEAYRLLVELNPVGVYTLIVDPLTLETKRLHCNEAYLRILGYASLQEWLAESTPVVFYSEADFKNYREHLLRDGKVVNYKVRLRRKDGKAIWVLMNATARNYEGKILIESIMTDITSQKRIEERLRSAQNKLRAMASDNVLADERSRQRLATELHDTVLQTLGAAKMRSELLKQYIPEEGAAYYTELQDMLLKSIAQSRLIMSEMSPPVLYELGFVPALEWLAEQMESQHDLAVNFETTEKGSQQLALEVQLLLFQATRELLMNVVKHAGFDSVAVKLSGSANLVKIEVIDKGTDFDTKRAFRTDSGGGGFCLFSIRERLRHLGGELKIRSKPGEGARVVMTAPRVIKK